MSARSYFKKKGYLSLSKTAQLLDPYFRYKVFSASKFNDKKYEKDKRAIIEYYNSIGYRDARIEKDTTYFAENGHLNIDVMVDEGNKYCHAKSFIADLYFLCNEAGTDVKPNPSSKSCLCLVSTLFI